MWHDDLLFDIRISQEVGQLIHGNIDFCHWRGVVDVLRAVQVIRGNILAIEQVWKSDLGGGIGKHSGALQNLAPFQTNPFHISPIIHDNLL